MDNLPLLMAGDRVKTVRYVQQTDDRMLRPGVIGRIVRRHKEPTERDGESLYLYDMTALRAVWQVTEYDVRVLP